MAEAALDQAQLDRVLFVVSAHPPHKIGGPYATAEERFTMVEAALTNCPHMEASRLEIDRPGPSYTVDTLRRLRALDPHAELFFIVGMDSLVDLPKWKELESILGAARLLVIPRPGHWHVPGQLEGCYQLIQFPETPLSSTEVRARIASGAPIDDLVPEGVARLIRQKGIYYGLA